MAAGIETKSVVINGIGYCICGYVHGWLSTNRFQTVAGLVRTAAVIIVGGIKFIRPRFFIYMGQGEIMAIGAGQFSIIGCIAVPVHKVTVIGTITSDFWSVHTINECRIVIVAAYAPSLFSALENIAIIGAIRPVVLGTDIRVIYAIIESARAVAGVADGRVR